jgi:hypothetical protein
MAHDLKFDFGHVQANAAVPFHGTGLPLLFQYFSLQLAHLLFAEMIGKLSV